MNGSTMGGSVSLGSQLLLLIIWYLYRDNFESGCSCHLLPLHSFITCFPPSSLLCPLRFFFVFSHSREQDCFLGGRNQTKDQNQNNRNPHHRGPHHMVGYDTQTHIISIHPYFARAVLQYVHYRVTLRNRINEGISRKP